MHKTLPKITESAEHLKTLLRQSKQKHQRDRLSVLYLLKSEQAKNRTQAADMTGVHRQSATRWLQIYREEGLEKLLMRKFPPGRVPTLTEEQQAHLRNELENPESRFSSYTQIQHFISETFGIEMKYQTVYAMVHNRWGAKLKVPRKSHEKKTKK